MAMLEIKLCIWETHYTCKYKNIQNALKRAYSIYEYVKLRQVIKNSSGWGLLDELWDEEHVVADEKGRAKGGNNILKVEGKGGTQAHDSRNHPHQGNSEYNYE